MTYEPSILIVAGEASADLHGAYVLRALAQKYKGARARGVGGEAMRALGLETLARAEELSLGGLTEVAFAIPRVLGIMRRLTRACAEKRPAVAVLIDLPDFNLRLAKKIKALGVPVIYYISPQLWAWRPGRVAKIRAHVDRMLVILPFEREFYRAHGVTAEFVGHPLVEELPPPTTRDAARRALKLEAPADAPVVALLPGSRAQELDRHLPTMLEALQILRQAHPATRALIAVASTISRALVEEHVARAGVEVTLVMGRASEVISAADAVVVCSGTATLQTALLLRPMVVVYRVSWLTYRILKRLVRVPYIALVNLIAEEKIVEELVQGDFTPAAVAQELGRLLFDHELRRAQESKLARLRDLLGSRGAAERVAEVIAGYLPPSQGAS